MNITATYAAAGQSTGQTGPQPAPQLPFAAMNFGIRPITEAEIETFDKKMSHGFGFDPHKDDDPNRLFHVLEPARTICAFDGSEMVGTCGAFSFDLIVPGATLPMGGTTMITVQPTHRRKGALNAMMQAHLKEIQDRGEPLAGLWASESSIYGRFGYGQAAEGCELELDAKTLHFTHNINAGAVKLLELDDARQVFPSIYERVRPHRPGMLSRSDAWWDIRMFHDPEHWRKGRTAKRFAVYESPAGPQGFAAYRQKEEWTDFPNGEVHIIELQAATADAHHALWQYLTSIDLYPSVQYWNAPVDDELPWRIADSRRVQRHPTDSLWLRPLDIERILSGRAYCCDARLVFGITDAYLPSNDGRYELDATLDGAQCKRTTTNADIELPVDALGAVYLGGYRFSQLARAGIVKGTDESLVLADRLFAWHRLPWCPEVF